MATGDYSNIALNSLGTRLTFTLEGMTASGITAVASGKTINLNATRQVDAVVGSDVTEEVSLEFLSAAVNTGAADYSTDFTAAASTNLTALGWTASAGTWLIATSGTHAAPSVLASTTRGSVAIATRDSSDADATIECVITNTGSNRFNGIAFRYSDNDNYLEAVADDAGDVVRLRKVVSGSVTELGTYTLGYAPHAGSPTTIRVVLSGSSIDVLVNGTSQITATDSFNSTQTVHGIICSGTSTADRTDSYLVNPGITSADITMGVVRPIHQSDVSITLDADIGAFNDGSSDSAAQSATAVTNSSTLAYFQPCGGIIGVLESGGDRILVDDSVVSGTITVQAQFDHPRGVDRVVFSANDGTNPEVTATATARTRSLYIDDRVSSTGRLYFQADLDLSGLDDGSITITATAYPTIGDGVSYAPTWTVYNNSGGTVATAMSGGLGWSWNGNFGGTAGTPPVVYVNSSTGNDSTGNGTSGSPYATVQKAVNELVAANCESWAEVRLMDAGPHFIDRSNTADHDSWLRVVGDSSLTGSGRAVIDFDSGHSDFPGAVNIVRGASSKGSALFNLIYNKAPGLFNTNLWLGKNATTRNLHGAWHERLDWATYTDSTKTLSGGFGQFTVAGIANAQGRSLSKSDKIYVTGDSATGSVVAGEYTIESIDEANDTITLTTSITGGTGDATDVTVGTNEFIDSGGRDFYVTDCDIEDNPSGPSNATLVRNVSHTWLAGDFMKGANVVIATKIRNFKGSWTGTGGTVGFHSDGFQWVSAVTNMLIDGVDLTADGDVQLLFFENSTSTVGGNGRHDRWSIMNSVFDSEDSADTTPSILTQFCRTCYGPSLRNNTFLGQKTLFRGAVGEEFIPVGGAIEGNIFHENSGQVLANQVSGGIDNNHYIAGTATAWDRNATSGGTVAAVITDRANNDYRIVSGSAVDNRSGDYYEGDLYGLARTGGIGAAEFIGVVEDITGQVQVDGTIRLTSQRASGLWGSTITKTDANITAVSQVTGGTRSYSVGSVTGAGTSTLQVILTPDPLIYSVAAGGTVTVTIDEGWLTDENGNTTAAFSGIADGDNSSTQVPSGGGGNATKGNFGIHTGIKIGV